MKMLKTFRVGMLGIAVAVGMGSTNSLFAANAATEVANFTGNYDANGLIKTVFEDDFWVHDPTGRYLLTDAATVIYLKQANNLPAGTDIINAMGKIVGVGNGPLGGPPLAPPSGLTPSISGYAIEAVLTGKVAGITEYSATAFETTTGNAETWVFIEDVSLSIFFVNNEVGSDVNVGSDTLATALAKFSNTPAQKAVEFGLDGVDDFFVLRYNGVGQLIGFEMALTVIDRNESLIGAFVNTEVGAVTASSASQVQNGAELPQLVFADIYGIGQRESTTPGELFRKFDGDFSAAILAIPTPAASGLGMLLMGALAVSRRQRNLA